MSKYTTYDVLETLADRYIPAGRHKYLHVDSRAVWIKTMKKVINNSTTRLTVGTLAKYAKNWEAVLVTRLSMLN